jgi:hypothetical protein
MAKAPHLPRGAVPDTAVPDTAAPDTAAPDTAAPDTAAPDSVVPDTAVPGVDTTKPSPARLYDYYLGGTSNFEVDRVAAEGLRRSLPELSDAAWANRGFHQRATAWLAGSGIRQFIDIGSGLPTVGNTHQVVQRVDPSIRVVYVDIDPMVAIHSAKLLPGTPNTAVVTADLRDPDTLLGHPDVRRLIDFTEPAGLLMTAVMHFVADSAQPARLVRRYLAALAPGSYLVLSHATGDRLPPRAVRAIDDVYAKATERIHLRPRAEVERFFSGLEILPPHTGAEPEICYVGQWGAEDPAAADSDGSRVLYCGVARCR